MMRLLLAVVTLAVGFASAAPIPKPKEPPPATEEQRQQSRNNLKKILIGMHNYEAAMQNFPVDGVDKKGKPLLSWRVLLLPYFEEDELFKQFKLDEPWDSETNKPLIAKIPKVYAPLRGKAEVGETFYRRFAGTGAPFEKGLKPRIGNFTDGLSNTIGVIEAGEPVCWTKPDNDLPFDERKPLPKLGGDIDGDFHAAFLDGSVIVVKRNFDEKTMKAAITHAGGEVFESNKLSPEKK